MKTTTKIFKTLLLTFSLSLFSLNASAQEKDWGKFTQTESEDSTDAIEICYDSFLKVKVKEKEGKETKVKESKVKNKETCFEISGDEIKIIDHKGKESVYTINTFELIFTSNGLAFMLSVHKDGKNYDMLIDYGFNYIGIRDADKGIITWYSAEENFGEPEFTNFKKN